MKTKAELDNFRNQVVQRQESSSKNYGYLLFSKGLPLLSPIIFNYFGKKLPIKNKTLKGIVHKTLTIGMPFIINTFFTIKKK